MTDIVAWLLFCFACYCIGYYRGVRTRRNKEPRIYDVRVSAVDTVRLHYLGQLPENKFHLLCWWVTDGKPFRLLPLMQAHVLSRGQFTECRDELLDRRMAYRKGRAVEITPPGYAFFRWGAGRGKQTISRQKDN